MLVEAGLIGAWGDAIFHKEMNTFHYEALGD
jgi:hypothetical protein